MTTRRPSSLLLVLLLALSLLSAPFAVTAAPPLFPPGEPAAWQTSFDEFLKSLAALTGENPTPPEAGKYGVLSETDDSGATWLHPSYYPQGVRPARNAQGPTSTLNYAGQPAAWTLTIAKVVPNTTSQTTTLVFDTSEWKLSQYHPAFAEFATLQAELDPSQTEKAATLKPGDKVKIGSRLISTFQPLRFGTEANAGRIRLKIEMQFAQIMEDEEAE